MSQRNLSISALIEVVLPGATHETLSFSRTAIERLPLAASYLRGGNPKGGFEIIAASSDGLELIMTCLDIVQNNSSSEESIVFAAKHKSLFSAAVAEVNSFMETGDHESIADLLEYEITPLLRELYERLQ